MLKVDYMYEIIEINGIKTWFSRHLNSKCNFEEDHFCAICNEKLKRDDNLYLIINNSVLFPNIWTHMKCVKNYGKYISVMFIKHKWEEFNKISNKYKSFIFYIGD